MNPTASATPFPTSTLALCRKKLGEPITKQFFASFSEHVKREKLKENVSENRSHGASSALCDFATLIAQPLCPVSTLLKRP